MKEEKSPNLSLSEEIAKEVRKSAQEVHINLRQMKQTPSTQNIISFVKLKTKDLPKIKRLLLYIHNIFYKFSSSNRKMSTLLGGGSCADTENSQLPKESQSPILLGAVSKALVCC